MTGTGPSFDRLRPRAASTPPQVARQADQQGKRALFSDDVQPPTMGSVALRCDACGERSVVSLVRLARLSLPGLHLPARRDGAPAWRAWVTCPACGRRSWTSVSVR